MRLVWVGGRFRFARNRSRVRQAQKEKNMRVNGNRGGIRGGEETKKGIRKEGGRRE